MWPEWQAPGRTGCRWKSRRPWRTPAPARPCRSRPRAQTRTAACSVSIARHQPVADGESERAASHRQQDVFREELPDQRPAPGAERGADDDFTFAGQAAREREIGEVGASDQEDETGRRHQHQERPAHVRANERVGIALHDNAPAFVRRRKLRGDPSADRAHGRLAPARRETPSFSRPNDTSQ